MSPKTHLDHGRAQDFCYRGENFSHARFKGGGGNLV